MLTEKRTRTFSKAEQDEFSAKLREMLKPGDTVYTTVRHVAPSGMSRVINVTAIRNNEPDWLSYWVAAALRWPFDNRREGVRVSGCGMDMGYHLIYELSAHLFPTGFDCPGKDCPSSDHFNRIKGQHHKNGGYALRQRWM